MLKPPYTLAAALFLVGVCSVDVSAQAADEDKSIEERREEARIERLWNLNWRSVAPFFIEHEGEFVCVSGYDRSKPSSVGQSISDYRDETVKTQEYEDERGKEQSRKLTKPEEEAFAAVGLIPEVEVGQYGYIHSGQIEEIIDDKTVELEDIWLIDADLVREEKEELKKDLWGEVLKDVEDAIRDRRRDRRSKFHDQRVLANEAIDWSFEEREDAVRRQRDSVFSRYTWVVKGYATGSLKEDARWPSVNAKRPGLQLIIVEVDGRTVTAVPAEALKKGITELQLIDYLQSRNLNKSAFVEIVTEAKREHRSEYAAHVLARISGIAAPAAKNDDVNDEVRLAD